jgi:hypothetical protein
MQQQPKLVGNKAVTAEAIGFERYLQILDPVFGFATPGIVIVECPWHLGLVSHYKSGG